MSPLFLRRGAALILGCVMAAVWLTLPVYALPQMRAARAERRDAAQETVIPSEGEETLREGSPVTEDANRPSEQDPIHAIGERPIHGGRWVAIALCGLTAVSLVLIIAAMIPRKRK